MKKSESEKFVAIYIRVSTDHQAEDGFSIEGQKERLTAYCTAMGITRTRIYCDAGFSGSTLHRPQMENLIRDIDKALISKVIVYKLDRLSRSQKDTLYLIEDVFIPNDVAFVSLNESFDTSTPYGRAMIGIISAFAQLERENIKLRTQMGLEERIKKGYWKGSGKVPYGYQYDKSLGILTPHPQESIVVKEMYNQYLSGISLGNIAKQFGFTDGKIVKQILCRRTNTGIVTYKEIENKGLHEPIIDKKIFDLTMSKMKERARIHADKSKYHLLGGIVFCGLCGSRMRYVPWRNSRYKLLCYSRERKNTCNKAKVMINCTFTSVWSHEVENAVLADILMLKLRRDKDNSDKQELRKIWLCSEKSLRQTIIRSLVDKIIITEDDVTIYYKLNMVSKTERECD